MKRQLRGIAIILFCILLTLAYGAEPVFDFSFHWSALFLWFGAAGLLLTVLPEKKQ